MEKRYRLISDKYLGLRIGNVYKSSDVINEYGEQVMDFVALYPNDWQEMNDKNEANEIYEILQKTSLEKIKMYVLIENHGIWKPLKVGEKYPFDYKLKGWTETIEECAKRHPHAWLEVFV